MKGDQGRAKVAEWYESAMKAQGWTQEMSPDMADMSSRSFKKDKRQMAVVATTSGEASDVMLSVTTEGPPRGPILNGEL